MLPRRRRRAPGADAGSSPEIASRIASASPCGSALKETLRERPPGPVKVTDHRTPILTSDTDQGSAGSRPAKACLTEASTDPRASLSTPATSTLSSEGWETAGRAAG